MEPGFFYFRPKVPALILFSSIGASRRGYKAIRLCFQGVTINGSTLLQKKFGFLSRSAFGPALQT